MAGGKCSGKWINSYKNEGKKITNETLEKKRAPVQSDALLILPADC